MAMLRGHLLSGNSHTGCKMKLLRKYTAPGFKYLLILKTHQIVDGYEVQNTSSFSLKRHK
jgi:hypothetical protein